MKREPTLLDYSLAQMEKIKGVPKYPPDIRHMLTSLRTTKPFVLDVDASRYAGQMVNEVPEAIAYGQEFALPPFTNCWIEYKAKPFWDAVNAPRLSDATADDLVGFHILGSKVYVWAWSHTLKGRGAGLTSFRYTLFHPLSFEEEVAFCQRVGTSRAQLDSFYWGESIKKFVGHEIPKHMPMREFEKLLESAEQDKEKRDIIRSLRANHSVEVVLPEGMYSNSRHEGVNDEAIQTVWANGIDGHGADLRNIIAMLLFLNRTSKVQMINDLPPAQGWVRAKPRTLVRHNVVTLKLNPLPQLIRLGGHSGAWRRLHDVRSHFCTNKRAKAFESMNPSHLHDWSEMRPHLWRCLHPGCGGLKWWRRAHQRGKAKFGHVETTYEVTE